MLRMMTSALLFLIMLFSGGLPRVYADWSISKISERNAPAVVKLTALDETNRPVASGSGFFVNRQGEVATNYHVLENASRVIVETANGDGGTGLGITRADPRVDLVTVRTSFRNTLPVILADSDRVTVGESVLVMGNSPGWEGTLSSGMIINLRRAGDVRLVQMTARILPGCSGSPVFNVSGEVIAVATAFLDSAYFAIPVNYLKFLKSDPLPLNALKEPSVKFEASLADRTLVDVLVRQNPGISTAETSSISSSDWNPPLTVYFKDGRKLSCDGAWKEGRTVFLVVHGRSFAVGYDEDVINMKKSRFY